MAAATLVVVAVAAGTRRYFVIGGLFAGGLIVGILVSHVDFGVVALHLPRFAMPPWSVAGSAFVLLVIPQIPLTYGNAVVGVSHLAREQFGDQARRVTPGRVALSCGVGNVVSAALGGMPMCHGSSGFTAHVRLGARTAAMNFVLGGAFLTLGFVFSNQVLVLFGLLPVWTLAGFLAYAGLRHALLILDLRGTRLAIALVAGVVGILTSNLAITTAVALVAEHTPTAVRRLRGRVGTAA
jgi:MFS superfamily sulfate permease-like transporter